MTRRPHAADPTLTHPRRRGGLIGLGLCASGIVVVWGWVLPAIGSLASVRAAIERSEHRGINPGAIFYTDVFQTLELQRAQQIVESR